MADSDGFLERNNVVAGGPASFSKLLLSTDDEDVASLNMNGNFHCSSGKSSKMLCFGGYQNENEILMFGDVSGAATRRSGVTCSDSSSVSSGNNNNNNGVNIITDSNRKRNRSAQEPVLFCGNIGQTPLTNLRTSRKAKTDSPSSTPRAKMRKEKLGDRITALQQLVSPFGKTDTASVLHEAMGYIRFLQDQVQVLCSPYLQYLPSSNEAVQNFGENGEEESTEQDLKSRGLCLMPVQCVVHVDSSNGADYWSPAMGNHFSSSSSTQE